MLTVGAVGMWLADDATVHPGCDLRGVGVMSLAHEFPWKGTYEVACHWRCLLMNGGWAEVFEVGSISAEWAGGGRARVPKWTLTLPKRGGKTMYQPWGAMKNLMRSERVVKNSLKNFLCETSDILLMYHEPEDLWTHYYSGLMDGSRGTTEELYWNFVRKYFCQSFITRSNCEPKTVPYQ